MAEVLGIAASIVALLQLAANVTAKSYGYIKDVKRAPADAKKFIDELNHLTKVLGTLQTAVNANPGSTALEKLNDQDGPLQGCIQELETFLLELEQKEVSNLRRILKRAKWPLKEKENSEFVLRMERHKTLLIFALSVDQFTAQESGRKTEDAHRNEEKRTRALNWLYPEPFDKRHIEISGRRQKGTGQWVLRTPEVQDWRRGTPGSRLLLGHGIPGGGKTFLWYSLLRIGSRVTGIKLTSSVARSSLMIDDLKDQAQTTHCGVAYIYFNYKEQGQQRSTNILASLVKQLACQMKHLPKGIEDLYDSLGHHQQRPGFEDLYKVLLPVANSFTQAFVICDALDECDQETQRKELLPLFHRMAKDGISLFLSSRGHPEDIQHSFQNSEKLELCAKDEDIVSYTEQKISENPRAERLVMQGKCKDQIISELRDCAKGMFLLVHFHIKHICQQTTVRQILMELEKIKSSSSDDHPMDPTYDRAMEALRAQPRSCTELALRILSWLVKAQRVLTVRELQQAVSIEQGCTVYNELDLPDRKTLLDVCASLVTIDGKGDTVRLVHLTTQEYLLRSSVVPEDADLKTVVACTTFLSLDVFAQGGCTSASSFESRLSLYPFLRYVVWQLHSHLESCNEDLSTEPVLGFLGGAGSIDSFIQVHTREWYLEQFQFVYPYDSYNARETPLHVAALLGHCTIARRILRDTTVDINSQNITGETPLQVAATNGRGSMVQLLLEQGADISVGDEYKRVALHLAARYGHELVVRLLLEKGADTSVVDEDGYTPLHGAARGGHESVARLLLEKGADIPAKDDEGYTALQYAVSRGHESVAQLLLGDINISDSTMYDSALLRLAASEGNDPLVLLLLEEGVDISDADETGITALHTAAINGRGSMVKLLLEKGANHLAADVGGKTALERLLGVIDKYQNDRAAVSRFERSLQLLQATACGK